MRSHAIVSVFVQVLLARARRSAQHEAGSFPDWQGKAVALVGALLIALHGSVIGAGARPIQAAGEKPAPQVKAVGNQQAREACLQGRKYLQNGTQESMERAVRYFDQATKYDPGYAPAYVGLADAYTLLWGFGFVTRGEALPKATEAATKAIALDDKLAEAHNALAGVKMRDWDWVGAEKKFKRALELDPSNVNIRHWYALYLAAMGRREDAFRESQEALRLDPSSLSIQTGAGAIEYFARDYKQMIKQMQSTVALGPNFAPGYDWLGMAYVQVGRFEEAIAVYQKAVILSGGSAEVKAGLAHAYGVAGQRASARAILGELNDLAKKKYVPPVQIAFVYLGLGDRAHALDLLEKAYQERSWELVFIQVEPWVDSLRSEPRFRDIVRRMNFPK